MATPILLIVFLYLLHQFVFVFRENKKRLPPGPIGLPILGHLHLMSKNPHQDLHLLARKHGPIMHVRFGSIRTVVVSSPAAAELVLKTHDHVFADRPQYVASNLVTYEHRDIIFGKYSKYWRQMRKLCSTELLSPLKIRQFQGTRKAELGHLVSSLHQAAQSRQAVDLGARVVSLVTDTTCLMVFGKKFTDRDLGGKGFKETMKETTEVLGSFNLGDCFPGIRRFDLQGIGRRMEKVSRIYDGFLERIIDDHVENKQLGKEESQDFVDTLINVMESGDAEFGFDRRNVKAVLLDTLIAGIETSATTIEWTLSELMKHPMVMKKLQKELEEMVGMKQIVEESHLSKLKYLDYVIRESLRLHPVTPLLVHESMQDCEVAGFHIPKKTQLFVNVWAIGRDPDAWAEPEKFLPDRFLGNNVDLRGRDFQLIPFGSGRRGCPGLQLGLTVVQLTVAQLVHCFDWELPNGMLPDDLEMSENSGLVTSKAKHLMAIPTYRLH